MCLRQRNESREFGTARVRNHDFTDEWSLMRTVVCSYDSHLRLDGIYDVTRVPADM